MAREKGRRAVDARIEAICLTAMSKDPEIRPKTAEAMAESLESWLDQDAARGLTVHVRHTMLLATATVAAVGALAVGALLLFL